MATTATLGTFLGKKLAAVWFSVLAAGPGATLPPGWTASSTSVELPAGPVVTTILSLDRHAAHCRLNRCRAIFIIIAPDQRGSGFLMSPQGSRVCPFTITVTTGIETCIQLLGSGCPDVDTPEPSCSRSHF